MALPLAPALALALRYGAVALASYGIARAVSPGRRDQRAEDALDALDEGATLRRDVGRDDEQINATGRWRRVIRRPSGGPGLELDLAAVGRLRLRKVP